MNKFAELLQLFEIDEKNIDHDLLLLSLTHKTVINEQKKQDYFKLLAYYYDIGYTFYSILLKQFIFEKVSKDPMVITKSYSSSRPIFIEDFISITNIRNYFIAKEDVLNTSVIHNLAYQFIGFLFVEGYNVQIEKFFGTIFDMTKLQLFNDYYGIVNAYAQAHKVSMDVKELEVIGPAHDQKFRYELLCNGQSIIAEGPTKRNAKKKCAKLYCNQYIPQDKMMIYSGFKQQQKRGKKKYIPSQKIKVSLQEFARKLGLSYDEVLICFTHVSLTNEFNVTNNSGTITIGADIERLYLLVKCYYKYGQYLPFNLFKITGYLQSQQEIYKNFIEKEKLTHAIMGANSMYSTEKSILKAYEDTFKALLFFLFYKNKSIKLLQKIDDVYEELLNKTDLRYISPTSTLQERLQQLNIEIEYSYMGKDIDYSCIATIKTSNFSGLQFHGVGCSKNESSQSAAEKALHWFYEKIEPFFLGTKENDLDTPFIEKLLYDILHSKANDFRKVIYKNNYFGMADARDGDSFDFINKIVNTFKITVKYNHALHKEFVSFIAKAPQMLMDLNGTDFLVEAIIIDIAEFIQQGNQNRRYSLERSSNNLRQQSNLLRKKYIADNGLWIRYISNPSLELQMIAVKNNPVAT